MGRWTWEGGHRKVDIGRWTWEGGHEKVDMGRWTWEGNLIWCVVIQQLHRDVNPADALLDLLKKEDLQKQLVASYWDSGDPHSIGEAVKAARTSRTPFSVEEATTFE